MEVLQSPIRLEMGLLKAGDANNDNRVNISDFSILRFAFGTSCGLSIYDDRADFTGDCRVNISDFNPSGSTLARVVHLHSIRK